MTTNTLWAISALSGALISISAVAQQTSKASFDRYLGVGSYFLFVDQARGTMDDGLGVQASYGWVFRPSLVLELRAHTAVIEAGSGQAADFYNSGGSVNLQYVDEISSKFSSYLGLGLGSVYNDSRPDVLDDWATMGSAYLGALISPMESQAFRVRVEGGYFYENYLNGISEFRVGLGLDFPLSRQSPPPPQPQVVYRDRPVPVPVAPRPEPADSDNDGVVDGVDRCPGTLPGLTVDQFGCVKRKEVQTFTLRNILFKLNSAELDPSAFSELDRAVFALTNEPGLEVLVAGHTDSTGSADYNQKLSEDRARSVARYFELQGVSPFRVQSVGYGEAQPVADNASEFGRSQNRRVELRFGPNASQLR